MNYIAFHFTITDAAPSEQLVALLSDIAFEGFEETDQQLAAFVPENSFDSESFNAIVALFPSLVFTQSIVENINWNQQWEESFEPVVVGDFAAIRASFHQPITTVAHEIIITPKMSFGTGHHGTTYLMIEQMKSVDFTGKTVLDFGTGTGVLAILAEKLGAAKVLAIDNDEWSITNAKENLPQNGCSKISIEQMEAIPANQQFDIILANINLNVITASLPAMVAAAKAPCQILLSGFLKENETVLKADLEAAGLNCILTAQKGEWITLRVVK